MLAMIGAAQAAPWPWEYREYPLAVEHGGLASAWAQGELITDGQTVVVELETQRASELFGMALWLYRDGQVVHRTAFIQDGRTSLRVQAGSMSVDAAPLGGSTNVTGTLTIEEAGTYEFLAWTGGTVPNATLRVYGHGATASVEASGERTVLLSSRDFSDSAGAHVAVRDASIRAQTFSRHLQDFEGIPTGILWSTEVLPHGPAANVLSVYSPTQHEVCQPSCYLGEGHPPGGYAFEITGAGVHTWRGADVYLFAADVSP